MKYIIFFLFLFTLIGMVYSEDFIYGGETLNDSYSDPIQDGIAYSTKNIGWNVTVYGEGYGTCNYTLPDDRVGDLNVTNLTGQQISYNLSNDWITFTCNLSSNNYTIRYETKTFTISLGDSIQGIAELNRNVSWTRDITVINTTRNLTNLYINISIPSCHLVGSVNVTNATDSIGFTDNTNYINWTIQSLSDTETKTYTIKYNTTAPSILRNTTEVVNYVWYKYFDINGSCVTYTNVYVSTTANESVKTITLYDNTTGTAVDVTTDEDYDYNLIDSDGNGLGDILNWTIPTISANSNASFILSGSIGIPISCSIKKEILNEPIPAGANIQWKWNITCSNLNEESTEFTEKIRVPVGASAFELDGVSKPVYIDKYGSYVVLEDSIFGSSVKSYILNFETKSVVVICTWNYPDEYYVDEDADVNIQCIATSYSYEDINYTIQYTIPISYGKGLKTYYNDKLVDTQSSVVGSYSLEIESIKSRSSQTYDINYSISTAKAEVQKLSDTPEGYKAVKIKITSLAHHTLENLYYDVDFVKCSELVYLENLDNGEVYYKNDTDVFNCIKNDEGEHILQLYLGVIDVGEEKNYKLIYAKKIEIPEEAPSLILLIIIIVLIIAVIIIFFSVDFPKKIIRRNDYENGRY